MGKCYGICFDNLVSDEMHMNWSYGRIFETEGSAILGLIDLIQAIGDDKKLDCCQIFHAFEEMYSFSPMDAVLDKVQLKVEKVDIGRRNKLGCRDPFFMYDDYEPDHTWGATFEYNGTKYVPFWIEEYDVI